MTQIKNQLENIAKTHLPQLNVIRGLASLAVAIYHLGGKNLPILNFGWLGVEMFFVLSGFVICWSLKVNYQLSDFKKFILKRLARIEPPYIISILLVLAFGIINSFIKNIDYQIDWINLFFHFAYLNNFFENNYLSPVYWTLGIEFQFYILIGLIFPILNYHKNLFIAIILFISILPIIFHFQITTIINYFSLFGVGIFAFMILKKNINIYLGYIFIVFGLLTCYWINGLSQSLTGLITIIMILFLSKSNTIIDFLAKISFSLYLTHDIVGSSLVIFVGNLFQTKSLMTKAISFSSGMIVSILFAYLFYLAVEKPFLKLSKKIT